MAYKIAAVTENGEKISSHFGMAPTYVVYTVDEGQIQGSEQREKPHHGSHGEHGAHEHGHHGLHDDMFAPISDCQVLLCGGMGEPAYARAQQAGLEVVLTGGDIRQAVEAYLQGAVTSDMRRIHHH
jgi:predicted Fe-Mo cluster-binding NifX family protein